MRKVRRWTKWTLLSVVAVLLIYGLSAVLLSFLPSRTNDLDCEKDKTIYLTTNGVHLDFILPRASCPPELLTQLHLADEALYLAFGWGDKGFYLETPNWSDLKVSTAVNALFLTSETAVHFTRYYRSYEHWMALPLCEEQLVAINDHIWATFATDTAGQVQEIPDSGYTPNDTFYEAEGSYNCIRTCNDWINQGLKKAGVRTSIWSPFDFGVLHFLKQER
jgi:uncharacterized protein (TIGR02117 family)